MAEGLRLMANWQHICSRSLLCIRKKKENWFMLFTINKLLLLLLNENSVLFQVEHQEGSLTVTREVDGGLEVVKIKTPAVLSADLRLNEPRYATLPNIMKAKKKPIKKVTAKDLGVDIGARIEIISVEEPPVRQAGSILPDVDALVGKLKEGGHVA